MDGRTDRQTDIIIANATLNYTAWPKLQHSMEKQGASEYCPCTMTMTLLVSSIRQNGGD